MKQTYKNFTVIVVDDGSTDGTTQYLRTHLPEVVVVPGTGDLWWAGATNAGVTKAMELSDSGTDYILTLNNDLVVQSNYLQALLDVAESNPNALIGSVSVHIDKPETVHFAGTRWSSKTAQYRPVMPLTFTYSELIVHYNTIETDLLPGRGILIPISLFTKIGLYDTRHFPHYMADEDFSLRAKAAGYKLLIATKAAVHNHVAATGLLKQKQNFKYYVDVFTSTKSPLNSKYRWNWAKRHATVFPPLYFSIDLARILKSLLIRS